MPRAIVCGAFCLGVITMAGAATQAPTVTVPIELMNNFPIVEVEIDGRRLPLMFDLGGSDQIVLSAEALRTLHVEPLDGIYAWKDAKGNRLESRRFRIPELRIGSLVMRDVTGHEDAEAATYRKTPAGMGYIGESLVRPFKLVLDYEHRLMTFIPRDSDRAEQDGCSGEQVPFDPEWDGAPVAKAETDFGELVFVWDTGAPMSLVRESLVTSSGSGVADLYVSSRRFVLGRKDFGPVRLRRFKFAEPAGVDGFIGHDFFADHVVCIDIGNQRFHVRPNA
jgi:hypothetical protein